MFINARSYVSNIQLSIVVGIAMGAVAAFSYGPIVCLLITLGTIALLLSPFYLI